MLSFVLFKDLEEQEYTDSDGDNELVMRNDNDVNLHDVQENECCLMNDVEENLLKNEATPKDVWTRNNLFSDLSLNEESVDMDIMDPEERALLDLLDLEEKAGDSSLLSPGFLMYPTHERLDTIPSQMNTKNIEHVNENILGAGCIDDGENSNSKGKEVAMTLESLKKAVTGKLIFRNVKRYIFAAHILLK